MRLPISALRCVLVQRLGLSLRKLPALIFPAATPATPKPCCKRWAQCCESCEGPTVAGVTRWRRGAQAPSGARHRAACLRMDYRVDGHGAMVTSPSLPSDRVVRTNILPQNPCVARRVGGTRGCACLGGWGSWVTGKTVETASVLTPTLGGKPGKAATAGAECRGTSLIRKRHPLGPYSRPTPRALRWSYGGGVFLREVPLYSS